MSWDNGTKSTVQKIPLLTVKAGPRDKDEWQKRLKEELQALIKYVEMNKAADMDWFTIKPSNREGTHWKGKCWYIHELIKYEFDFQVGPPTAAAWQAAMHINFRSLPAAAAAARHCLSLLLPSPPLGAQFDIPATYPTTAPEIEIPELEGKTAKMYRGGKICLTIHFKPLWAKNRCVLAAGCQGQRTAKFAATILLPPWEL